MKMSTQPMNPDDVEITVREIKEKPGKPIVVVFEDCRFLSDVRCLGNDDVDCLKCKLRFKCLSCYNLEINFLKELRCEATDSFEISLSDMIKIFLNRNNAKKQGLDNESGL